MTWRAVQTLTPPHWWFGKSSKYDGVTSMLDILKYIKSVSSHISEIGEGSWFPSMKVYFGKNEDAYLTAYQSWMTQAHCLHDLRGRLSPG